MSTNLTRRPDPLEDFFRGFFVRPVDFGGHPLANVSTDAPQMRVDVKEKADAYEVHAELPGMKKDLFFGKLRTRRKKDLAVLQLVAESVATA